MSLPTLDDTTLNELYTWLDTIPFSRKIRNIARDFSDGILVAELVRFFRPKLIDMSTFSSASSSVEKRYNWSLLNKKVFSRLNFHVPNNLIHQIVLMRMGAIELVMINLRLKIDLAISQQRFHEDPTTSAGMHPRPTTIMCPVLPNRPNSRASDISDVSSTNSQDSILYSPLSAPTRRPHGSLSAVNSPQMPRQRFLGPSHSRKSTSNTSTPKRTPASNPLNTELVPAGMLYQAKAQLLQKDEEIQVLHARIQHMEQLVLLKDERIQDLTERMERFQHEAFHQQPQNWSPQPLENGDS